MEPKVIPPSLNPNYLPKYKKRVLNNVMPHQSITPTFCCGLNIMTFLFMLFVGLTYLFYNEAETLNEFDIRYDEACKSTRGSGYPCEFTFTPDVDMKNPKVYYRLNNFYQNHRSFQKFSFSQLRGVEAEKAKITQCGPVQTNKDMMNDLTSWDISQYFDLSLKTTEGLYQPAWPCGFIAKFTFSDRFLAIQAEDRTFNVQIDDRDIAHSVDTESRFKINADQWRKKAYWQNPEDQHMMVWYQMESLKDFVKLYGRIDGSMKAGRKYTITIMDNYASEKIDNEKHLFFSEIGTFGGKNYVLAYFFAGAAIIAFLVILSFVVLYFAKMKGKRFEEESYIKELSY